MIRNRMRVRMYATVVTLTLAMAASATAEISRDPKLANIRINNFGQINDSYYRGAKPQGGDYAALASIGVKTVIDLRRGGPVEEKGLVERAGMKFYRIPMTTSDRPAEAAVAEFLKIVNDPANQPVYVHCEEGRHRTGVMTAVYRMNKDGWNADRAYAEMKQYNFEGFLNHSTLKKFVFDYSSQLDRLRTADLGKTAKTLSPQ